MDISQGLLDIRYFHEIKETQPWDQAQESGIEANSHSEVSDHLQYFNKKENILIFIEKIKIKLELIKQCDESHYSLCVSSDQEMINCITNAEVGKEMTTIKGENHRRNHIFFPNLKAYTEGLQTKNISLISNIRGGQRINANCIQEYGARGGRG